MRGPWGSLCGPRAFAGGLPVPAHRGPSRAPGSCRPPRPPPRRGAAGAGARRPVGGRAAGRCGRWPVGWGRWLAGVVGRWLFVRSCAALSPVDLGCCGDRRGGSSRRVDVGQRPIGRWPARWPPALLDAFEVGGPPHGTAVHEPDRLRQPGDPPISGRAQRRRRDPQPGGQPGHVIQAGGTRPRIGRADRPTGRCLLALTHSLTVTATYALHIC